MAFFKDTDLVKKNALITNLGDVWDQGEVSPYSGIYICEGCGKEISHNADVKLPPQNHHQHSPSQGNIRWRLLVKAETYGNPSFK